VFILTASLTIDEEIVPIRRYYSTVARDFLERFRQQTLLRAAFPWNRGINFGVLALMVWMGWEGVSWRGYMEGSSVTEGRFPDIS